MKNKIFNNILKEVSVLIIITFMIFSSTMAIKNIDYNHTPILIDYKQNQPLDVNQILTLEKQEKLGIIDEENFEIAVPPTGWTQVKYGTSTGEWIREFYPDDFPYTPKGSAPPPSNDYFADADSFNDHTTVYDASLFTPPYDLTACGGCIVTLEYQYVFMQWGPDIARVNTYSGPGMTFEETLIDYTNSISPGYYIIDHEFLKFNVCNYTDPTMVFIEFYYSTNGQEWKGKFGIDDFNLSCCDATINIPTFQWGFNPIPIEATITHIWPSTYTSNWNIGWTLTGGTPPSGGTNSGQYTATASPSSHTIMSSLLGPGAPPWGAALINIEVSADCAAPDFANGFVFWFLNFVFVFIW